MKNTESQATGSRTEWKNPEDTRENRTIFLTVESMQTQEIRLLLERELGVISKKACGLIHQTIKKSLADCVLSLEDMDVGHSEPGAARDRGVSVLQHPSWAQKLSEWPDHAVWGCPVGEWGYQ